MRTHARTGLAFSEVGLGTAPLGNLFAPVPDAEADAVLAAAWDGGIRHFDTAPLYGRGLAETRLGRALRGRPRDGYVLASKVGRLLRADPGADGDGKWFDIPARREVLDYSYDGVMRSFEDSLERLGADRIDILHAHDLDARNQGGWEALERRLGEFVAGGHRALHDLRSQGVIRAIGLGVNEWEPAQWLAERADLDVILLAGRYTLLEQEAARSFLPLCEARGIGVVVGGPYNSGVLAGDEHYDYGAVPPEVRERVARLRAACDAHDVRLIDAALQFPLRHPAVLSVIPGPRSLPELRATLAARDAAIPDALWRDLAAARLIPA